ncbi:MAG TPA: OmpA family protein [Stellaceae bacterium]|nr:OmpA family protein [Stellaceae bacterium]
MTKRLSVLSAVLLCSVSGAAMAQQTNGFYVGGAAGASFLEDSKLGGNGLSERFKTGYEGLGVVGYGFGNGLRTELEGGYRRNDVDKIGGKSSSGAVGMTTGFGNLLYDFDTGTPFTPHIGAGLGVADIRETNARSAGNPTVSGHDTVFAYQLIGGVDYSITPDLKVGIDYHYVETDAARLALQTTPKTTSSNRFYDHSVLLALRYEFNNPAPAPVVAPPPPPPPPAPAPQLQRAFQVFFDFDKSTVTAAAQSIIDQAAASVKQGNMTRINVTGHTDTVGSAKYNQALSERRAAAVKAALIKDGIPDGQIATRGVGKSDLLVPTGDGVREAQNRRAEIVLQ